MGIRSRLGGAAAAVTIAAATLVLPAGPAWAADQPGPPTTIPILGPLLALLNPPPPPPPAPPVTAAPAPPAPASPAVPPGSGVGKRIVYCVTCQRVWLVEANEAAVDTHAVSGRAGVPRPGTYAVFSRSERATSGSVTMRNMVRFTRGRSLAIGFHSIPRDRRGRPIQSESELGQYRSHGCVRQADAEAQVLWNFAPIGTKVVVI